MERLEGPFESVYTTGVIAFQRIGLEEFLCLYLYMGPVVLYEMLIVILHLYIHTYILEMSGSKIQEYINHI